MRTLVDGTRKPRETAARPAVQRVTPGDPNRILPRDRSIHEWYRFVLSFPPHLVRDYLTRLGVKSSETVLDPFCGTGTTLVECRKRGIASVGLERNPMAHFASSVKVDWEVDPDALEALADRAASDATVTLAGQGLDGWSDLPLSAGVRGERPTLQTLAPERVRLLLKNSISPLPLHKTLVVLDALDRLTPPDAPGGPELRACGRLAMARALVKTIGNLRFGPEVGVGVVKDDAPVVDCWRTQVRTMAEDLRGLRPPRPASSSDPGTRSMRRPSAPPARVLHVDARDPAGVLAPRSVDAVITSPPYPNEKDYTRTTRLESVILGMITTPQELRALKKGMVRSNTRGGVQGGRR